jgi:hypothetical protein
VAIDGILQPGERRLAGDAASPHRQPTTDQREPRVGAQGIGFVLVFVAAGNLAEAPADERLQRVVNRTAR